MFKNLQKENKEKETLFHKDVFFLFVEHLLKLKCLLMKLNALFSYMFYGFTSQLKNYNTIRKKNLYVLGKTLLRQSEVVYG